MKTYTTTQGQNFTINYASSIFAGYGHQKITVEIASETGDKKEFWHKTDNMPDFDEANDLEYGQEKFEALFELVESKLDGEICEWISEIESYYYISGYSNGNEIGWITHDGKFSLCKNLDASSRMIFDTEEEALQMIEDMNDKEISETFEYRVERSY